MGSLILLVVAAIWFAVLVPPLLRSRLENRPNSSVSDFRNQLSSLQKAMPSTRSVSMRGIGRPLAPSALARPAAPARPLRSGVSLAGGGNPRSPRQQAALRPARPEPTRAVDSARRARVGDGPTRSHARPATPALSDRDAQKRRRANVLFVLTVLAACSVFLAATTKTVGLAYVAGAACLSLVGYVFMLAQQAHMKSTPVRARRAPSAHRTHAEDPFGEPRRDRRQPVPQQFRGQRATTPASRRRPVEDCFDEDIDDSEMIERQATSRHERHEHRTQYVARSQRDDLTARRHEPRRPWSEDPRPSGAVYGEPTLFSREQPVVRRERRGHRTVEWSPAV